MKMTEKKLALINEQTSPLFRLMWLFNFNEPKRRNFDNNISAFHIGNGYILSVAHNIKMECKMIKSFDEALFNNEILPFLTADQLTLFNKCYPFDDTTKKRYLSIVDPGDINMITDILKSINFDTRWVTLTKKKVCAPYLIIQFTNNQFYNSPELTTYFSDTHFFHEPTLNRHTFLIETELVEAYYSEDIALYKMVNTHTNIINQIPSINVDYSVLDDIQTNFYCLQSSPGGFLGRLLNKATIEGYLDHHATFADRIGGNYTFEGTRYLIKGYFRFGSSGAPYVYYNNETGKFYVNAIQSEACPIQLSINNNREGNFQYINALASPLQIIKESLEHHLIPTTIV